MELSHCRAGSNGNPAISDAPSRAEDFRGRFARSRVAAWVVATLLRALPVGYFGIALQVATEQVRLDRGKMKALWGEENRR